MSRRTRSMVKSISKSVRRDIVIPLGIFSQQFKEVILGCSITLTGDITGIIGGSPMLVSGQTVSVPAGDPTTSWFASTDLAGVPLPPPNEGRIFEVKNVVKTGTNLPYLSAQVASIAGNGVLRVTREGVSGTPGDTYWGFYYSTDGGGTYTTIQQIESPVSTVPAIGVDSAGNPLAFLNGAVIDTSAAGAIFSGNVIILIGSNKTGADGSVSADIVTNGADFQATYQALDIKDWCGNTLIEQDIFLVGGIAAAFGGVDMIVDGQTASATQVDPAVPHATSADITPPSSGVIVTEVDLAISGEMLAQALIGDVFTGSYVAVTLTSTGYSVDQTLSGVTTNVYNSPSDAVFALGYGSDGSLYAYVNGVQVSTSDMEALFPLAASLVASSTGGTVGDTASVTFNSNNATFQASYPSSVTDWSGGSSDGFDPETTFIVNSYEGAMYDPSDLTTLFQDDLGLIPVTSHDEPVGLMLDKSGNGMHLSQTDPTRRPLYKTDGVRHWLKFNGTTEYLIGTNTLTTGNLMMGAAVFIPVRPTTAQVIYSLGSTTFTGAGLLDVANTNATRIYGTSGTGLPISGLTNSSAIASAEDYTIRRVVLGRVTTTSSDVVFNATDTFASGAARVSSLSSPNRFALGCLFRTGAVSAFAPIEFYGGLVFNNAEDLLRAKTISWLNSKIL